jgi:hypothetical protein
VLEDHTGHEVSSRNLDNLAGDDVECGCARFGRIGEGTCGIPLDGSGELLGSGRESLLCERQA